MTTRNNFANDLIYVNLLIRVVNMESLLLKRDNRIVKLEKDVKKLKDEVVTMKLYNNQVKRANLDSKLLYFALTF